MTAPRLFTDAGKPVLLVDGQVPRAPHCVGGPPVIERQRDRHLLRVVALTIAAVYLAVVVLVLVSA